MASASRTLVRDPDLVFVDRYTEINEYLLHESERKEQERKDKLREDQRQQRIFLDEQVRLQREAADRVKADEHKYEAFERERRERWNGIDAAKRREMKEKEAAQKFARDAQVREVEARKAAAKQQAADADRASLQRIRGELREERIAALTRRYEEAENMRKVVEQNERNLEMAAEIRHRQFLEGQKVGIEYKKILDRQERDREEQLAATYSRMAKQAVHANFLHDQVRTEGARDEARALERQRRDAEARDAELAMRDETRKALQAECNRVLALQVSERKKASVRTQREEAAIVQLEARFNSDAAAKDAAEKDKRAAFVRRYHDSLSEQIKTDRVRKQMIGYTLPLAETQMNAALLRTIEAAGMDDRRAATRAALREKAAASKAKSGGSLGASLGGTW